VLGDPDIPVGADREPVVHVGVERIAHRIRQCAVGAAVKISLALEHRESAPQRREVYRHLAPFRVAAPCPDQRSAPSASPISAPRRLASAASPCARRWCPASLPTRGARYI